jgi:tetratricopeptide (TPR) repeat protein
LQIGVFDEVPRGVIAMQDEDKQEGGGKALLFQLRGEQPGVAYPLPRDVFRIGSDEGNDLVLKDRDVQPQQLEISFSEDRFIVKSLSSEGSVFLNGEPFEKSTFQKGDILTVGESMFRYVDLGETLSQEDLWRPVGGKQGAVAGKKAPLRRVSFLMVLVFFAAGALLLFLFTQGNRDDETQPGASGKLTDMEKPVDREELKVQYENGKDLLAARRWDEAILVFEGIRKQMPNFMDVESLYQEALWESEYVDNLNQGKGLVLENELVDAMDQIELVPKKSVYYREAERLTREIEDMILVQRLQAATAALAREDWSFAKREAEAILAKYPNNKDARRIVLEARLLQRQVADKASGVHTAWTPRRPTAPVPAATPRPSESSQPGGTPSTPPPTPSKPVRAGPRKGTPSWYIQNAIAQYRQGETEKSIALLEKASNGSGGDKARALIEDLQSATTHFNQAKTLQREGRFKEALEVWERFLERDRNIVGDRGGTYFLQASVSLARIYYDRGKKEFDRGNPIGAALFWKMGKKINPKDKDLRRGFVQLDEIARKIYREGYSLQEINIEEAIDKWNEVMMILLPDHPYYKKAKQRIDRYAERP